MASDDGGETGSAEGDAGDGRKCDARGELIGASLGQPFYSVSVVVREGAAFAPVNGGLLGADGAASGAGRVVYLATERS
jgi:hypothetical protein